MEGFDPRKVLANVIGTSLIREEQKRKKQKEAVATVVVAAALASTKRPVTRARAVTPAPPALSPNPVVNALPNVGVGTAPPRPTVAPAAPPTQATTPIGGAGPVSPTPSPSLGDNIGNLLGPIKDNAASAVGYEAPANPLDNIGNVLGGPQDKILTDQGADMAAYVNGDFQGAEKVIAENLPGKRATYNWAAANPEKVKHAMENGYTTDDGRVFEPGGRAVWEAFAADNLRFEMGKGIDLGPQGNVAFELAQRFAPGIGPVVGALDDQIGLDPQNLAAMGANLITDPYNALGGPSKNLGAKIGAVGAGRVAEGALGGGTLGALGKAVGAPDAGLDAAINMAGRGAGKLARPVMDTASKTRMGQMVGSWFETSPRARAEQMLGNIMRGIKQEDEALANQVRVADPFGTSPPLPAPLDPGISPPDTPPIPPPRPLTETPGGWRITDEFDPGAPNTTRRLIGDEGSEIAQIDLVKRRANDERTWRYMVRDIVPNPNSPGGRTTGRGKGFDNLNDAMTYVDQKFGSNPARTTEEAQAAVATLQQNAGAEAIDNAVEALQGAEVVDAGPLFYEHIPSPSKSNRDEAYGRFFNRSREHVRKALAANNPQLERDLLAIETEARNTRDAILTTTESVGGDPDVINEANRFELWTNEHLADVQQRRLLEEAGIDPGPYRNNQPGPDPRSKEAGAYASLLDRLSWDPNEEQAMAAADKLEAKLSSLNANHGSGNMASFQLEDAIDLALENRSRFIKDEAVEVVDDVVGQVNPYAHLDGLSEADRTIFRTAIETPGPRQNKFVVASSRMEQITNKVQAVFDNPNATDDEYMTALDQYRQAQEGARRLVETEKRDQDYINMMYERGGTSMVEGAVTTAGVPSADPVGDAIAAADNSFTAGPIVAPEVGELLGRTFEKNQNQLGRGMGEVARELRGKVAGDQQELIRLLTGATSQLEKKDATLLARLQKEYGVQNLQDAVNMSPDDMWRRRLRDELFAEVGYDGPGRFGGLDTASRLFSSINLLQPPKFVGYYLANLMGDSWQIWLTHGKEALAAANDPDHLWNITQYARKGGEPLEGAIGDLVTRAGLGGYHPTLMGDNFTEAMYRNETKAVTRAAGSSRLNLLGGIDKVTGKIIDPFRNISNGLEWAHRTGLWGWSFEKRMMNAPVDFLREMTPVLQKHGITEQESRKLWESGIQEYGIKGLGTVTDGVSVADRFGQLALAKGVDPTAAKGLAEEMGRKWQSVVYKADEAAVADVNKALFSFQQKNIDVGMRRVAPYTMWMSRAYPFYAEQLLRHPGFAATYYQTMQATQENAKEQGWPAPLQFMAKIHTGPGGMSAMINPAAFAGMFDFGMEAAGGYTPDNVGAVQEFLTNAGNFGFSLLPWWGAGLNVVGAMGDGPMTDPIGQYQARKTFGAAVQYADDALGLNMVQNGWKPYEQVLNDIRSAFSGKIPGTEWVPPVDASQAPVGQIRNVMLRNAIADNQMDMNSYLMLVVEANDDPEGPAAQFIDEFHGQIVSEELSGGAQYQRAAKEVAEGDALNVLVGGFLPGPKSYRQDDALGIQGLANQMWAEEEGGVPIIPGVGPIPTDEDPALSLMRAGAVTGGVNEARAEVLARMDPRDVEFLKRWAVEFGQDYRKGDAEKLVEAAQRTRQYLQLTPQAATLVEAQNNWGNIGTEEERRLLQEYNDIAFGEAPVRIPTMKFWATTTQMQSLGQQERWSIADAWLAEKDPTGEVQRLKDLREVYENTHPEFGSYKTWSRDTRNQWGEPRAFWQSEVQGNASFRYFIETETRKLRNDGKTPSEILEALDQEALSLDGYMAYNGIQKTRYSPEIETGTHSIPLAQNGATGEGLGGGGGYGGGQAGAWGDQVQTALMAVQSTMRASKEMFGVRLDEIPIEIRSQYEEQLPKSLRLPADAWIYDEYTDFYYEQGKIGGDQSVEAFIRATENRYGSGTVPLSGQELQPALNPNAWPPQPMPETGFLNQ